jgi:hypothetical protein
VTLAQLIHSLELGIGGHLEGSFGGGPVPCYFGAPRVQHRDNRAVPSRPQAGGRRATQFIARNGQERRELEHGNWNCEVV